VTHDERNIPDLAIWIAHCSAEHAADVQNDAWNNEHSISQQSASSRVLPATDSMLGIGLVRRWPY
jgi:hypothetical protein